MTEILNSKVEMKNNVSADRSIDSNLITDEKLFHLCKTYGENARHWKQKFAGLLPEVYKRRLYKKKHFESIYEFAAKLAGMSHEQVRLVLSLEQKFEDKPTLHSLLINGKVSANKLVRIAAIATTANQEDLANCVQVLSKNALETFVRDEKNSVATDTKNEDLDGLQKALFNYKSLPGQDLEQAEKVEMSVVSPSASPLEIIKLKLDADVLKELLELQGKNIDVNSLIRKMLNNRKTEIARAKDDVAAEIARRCAQKTQAITDDQINMNQIKSHIQSSPASRYIPSKIRKIINEEQGDKCSIPGCAKPAKVMHHELPFAITKNHDPNNLKKLCKAHHELRHMINVKFYERSCSL